MRTYKKDKTERHQMYKEEKNKPKGPKRMRSLYRVFLLRKVRLC